MFWRHQWFITVQSYDNMESICFIKQSKNYWWWCHLHVCPPIDHKYIKEPIKMHVEFSLLYKTLIIEMRSKILKAKGGAVQVLNIVDILSMIKVIDNRKLWLISFLQWHWNFYASLMHQNFWKITHIWHGWLLHFCWCCYCCFNLCDDFKN